MKKLFLFVFFVSILSYGQHPNDTIYVKSLDEQLNSARWGSSIIELSDNSFMLSYGFNGGVTCGARPGLMFIESNGNAFNNTQSSLGNGRIRQTSDGNFINVRNVNNTDNCSLGKIQIAKFDYSGEILWSTERSYGICNNQVFDVVETNDGGYAVIGIYSITGCSWPFYNSFLIKFNSLGEEEWVRHYGSEESQIQTRVLLNSTDNGFIFLTFNPPASSIMKADASGNIEWTTPISGNNNLNVSPGDMDVLPNGDIIFTGTANENHILARLSSSGSVEDFFSYSRSGIESPISSSRNVKYIEDIDMYLFTSDRIFIVDTTGNIRWKSINLKEELSGFYIQSLNDVIITENGDILITGATGKSTDNPTNYFSGVALLRFSNPSLLISNHEEEEESGIPEVLYYPNPTSDYVIINLPDYQGKNTMEVVNVLGQIVYKTESKGERQIKVPIEGANGTYFLRISSLNINLKIIKR